MPRHTSISIFDKISEYFKVAKSTDFTVPDGAVIFFQSPVGEFKKGFVTGELRHCKSSAIYNIIGTMQRQERGHKHR